MVCFDVDLDWILLDQLSGLDRRILPSAAPNLLASILKSLDVWC